MLELLKDIVEHLVVNPDQVLVTEMERNGTTVVTIKVDESDMGKVIGKNGKIARALRSVAKAMGGRENKKVFLEIG